jgi:phosphohistidine swiveling domain-containing protein
MNKAINKSAENLIELLSNTTSNFAGGKALGLKHLMDTGVNVPDGIVLVKPDENILSSLRDELEKLNHLPKAVRSSAVDEDGDETSFAGQFESFLNLSTEEEIIDAVLKCIDSSHNERVTHYSHDLTPDADLSISVIIQDMVDAAYAGVLFTADPVLQHYDRYILSVTEGLGEKLVSGEVNGAQYTYNRNNQEIDARGDQCDISSQMRDQIISEGLYIQKKFKKPLDLEWAINKEGKLFWLQARPITTLSDVHINELDATPEAQNTCITRCNIGEMMPGPVTPLTASVFGRAIDYGLQDFMIKIGVSKEIIEENKYIPMYYNHLFMSISELQKMTALVMMTTKENIEYSIVGYALKDDVKIKNGPRFKRFINFFRYLKFVNSSDRRLKELKKQKETFSINLQLPINELYNDICLGKQIINEAWSHHYVTSSKSGALNAFLLQVMQRGSKGTDEEHLQDISSLMVNVGNVDGADAVNALEKLADTIRENNEYKNKISNISNNEILEWLQSNESHDAGKFFNNFLTKHGHRCVKEAELREKDWAAEPAKLIEILKTRIFSGKVRKDTTSTLEKNLELVKEKLDPISFYFIKRISRGARKGVASRENSKSKCIKMQSILKNGYLTLADKMIYDKLLDDQDQIFFLTHEEIGRCIINKDITYKEKASKRRNIFPEIQRMQFDDIYYGYPEPAAETSHGFNYEDNILNGIGVSRGIVKAKARVINNLEEADKLKPGEIMIVAYTDVGWSPYFSIIGGLITEIGSTLSHGAVVAREYGIPAIVSAKSARKRIKTGDTIEIDGSTGKIIFS